MHRKRLLGLVQYTCQKSALFVRLLLVLDYDSWLCFTDLRLVRAVCPEGRQMRSAGGRNALPPCAKAFPTLPNFEVALDKDFSLHLGCGAVKLFTASKLHCTLTFDWNAVNLNIRVDRSLKKVSCWGPALGDGMGSKSAEYTRYCEGLQSRLIACAIGYQNRLEGATRASNQPAAIQLGDRSENDRPARSTNATRPTNSVSNTTGSLRSAESPFVCQHTPPV
jgi:hypothetical protein